MPKRTQFYKLSDRHKRRIIAKESHALPIFNNIDSSVNDAPFNDNATVELKSLNKSCNVLTECSDKYDNSNYSKFCAASSTSKMSVELFEKELCNLIIKHRITHSFTNDLLKLLNKFGNFNLPNDARTLLQTPRQIVSSIDCSPAHIYT